MCRQTIQIHAETFVFHTIPKNHRPTSARHFSGPQAGGFEFFFLSVVCGPRLKPEIRAEQRDKRGFEGELYKGLGFRVLGFKV